MKYFFALICIMLGFVFAVPIAFGLGFIMQLLLNPILAYFGIKAVSTTVCASILLFLGFLRLIF